MKLKACRILSVLMAVVLLSLLCVPAFASSGSAYNQKTGFWDWAVQNPVWKFLGISDFVGYAFGLGCPTSEDGYHHANSYQADIGDGTFKCICTYCGHGFTAYESDLQQSYTDYTVSLPATGYNSSGNLVWRPTIKSISVNYQYMIYNSWPWNDLSGSISYGDDGYSSTKTNTNLDRLRSFRSEVTVSGFPVAGSYHLIATPAFYIRFIHSGKINESSNSYAPSNWAHYDGASSVTISTKATFESNYSSVTLISFTCYSPVFEVIPDSAVDHYYPVDTRPTTITGGNYGIVGDNNELTIVNGDIINETNNTYYNPATGQGDTITNWSYDYSDRSYNVTLQSGDTVSVTYGDQNITIVEGGDTYIIYYIIQGQGSGSDPDPDPDVSDSGSGESHVHNWTQTGAVQGNCLTPSQRTYTCSVCGEQYTETDPVLGHSWRIIQEVSTKYDDSGNLTQEGYTIYECERCGEQYKSTNVTGPPSSGGSGSGGSSGSGGNIFSSIFGLFADFLSFFIDFFTGFVVGGIKGFLSAILDVGSDLFAILNPFDWGY